MHNTRIQNICLILFSLTGYLEWGSNRHSFLLEAEYEVLLKLWSDPLAVLHPLTILPLIGQLLLLIAVFQKSPGKYLTLSGMLLLGLLMLLILIVGMISMNFRMILSVLPFLVTAVWVIRKNFFPSVKRID